MHMLTKIDIQKELLYLGMRPSLKGFEYAATAIELYTPSTKITDLYKQVAKKHKTTASRVERAIRNAREIMTDDHIGTLEDKFNKRYGLKLSLLFGMTNADFITLMKFALENMEVAK